MRAPLGCFNLHASLLPRWRGAAPIHRAIMAGDAETGVMVMQMDEGLDTGPMAMVERVPIGARHDRRRAARRAGAARRRPDGAGAGRAGARQRCSSRRSRPRASPTPPRSTRPRRGSTGRKPWQAVHDHIRGLSPFPGAWCELPTARRPREGAAHDARARAAGAPGTVLDDRLTVACGEGAVRLVELQHAGRHGRCRRRNSCAARPLRAGYAGLS